MKNKGVYELIGIINGKKLDKVRNKKSPHYGTTYYRLAVELENKLELKGILVFQNFLTNKAIWEELTNWKDYDQRYLLTCQRKPGAGQVYRLLEWKKLQSHGSN